MVEFLAERGDERQEKRKGEEMTIKEVFVPLRTIGGVGELGVKTHDRG